MPGFGCFLIGQVYKEEILKNPGPQCGFSHTCGLLGRCLLLGKPRMESVVEGFSSGQSWPSMPLSFVTVLPVADGWPWPTYAPEERSLTWLCWLPLVPFAASRPAEHNPGRQLM